MVDTKKISDAVSASGQPTPEDLQQVAQAGFQSVLNLRSPDEVTALQNEQQHAENAGLIYAQVSLQPNIPDASLVQQAIARLEGLPKPVLIHCAAGARASAIALIATAQEQSWTLTQLTQKAEELGINPEQPHLQQFIQQASLAKVGK